MTSAPLVSVIVPVHNGAQFLPRAISSIRQQGYAPLEIVVVDDGSTDGSATVAAGLGPDMVCVSRPRGGPAAARNAGLAVARGTLIAFLDVDDTWPPDKLWTQVGWLLDHPDTDVVFGRIQPAPPTDRLGRDAPAPIVAVQLGSGVFRTTVFDAIGRFDESLTYSEDHDWLLRAKEHGVAMSVLDAVGLRYETHAGSMTARGGAGGYQLARVLKRSLDRRRAGHGGAVPALPRLSDFRETAPRPTLPLVSVILPVLNGERFLAEAIEGALAQTYPHVELIVVDDGSTDGTAAVAHRFGDSVRYVFQPNAGTAAARNHGVELARGDLFAFLDADDTWPPDKLALQVAALAADPSLDMVFGMVVQFSGPAPRATARAQPGYLPAALLVRREAFFKVGWFDVTWRIGEWADWYVRATDLKLNMLVPPQIVAYRRVHADNKGASLRGLRVEYVRLLKASLDRRRAH